MAVAWGNSSIITSGTGNVTPTMVAGYSDGDVVFIVCESSNETISTPSGWTLLTGTPVSVSTSGQETRLTIFWQEASGTVSSPTLTDAGDHIAAVTFYISGVDASDFVDTYATATTTTATTAISFPTVTTTVADTLILNILARNIAGSNRSSGEANASLANLTERRDVGTSSGTDGGLLLISGDKAAAGAVSATTSTNLDSVTQAKITLAFKGSTGTAIATDVGSLTLSGQTPTIAVTSSNDIAVGAGSAVLASDAPTIAVTTGNVNIAVGAGELKVSADEITYATLDPAKTGGGIVLSNGNLTFTGGSSDSTLTDIGMTSGVWFWEFIPSNVGSRTYTGVGTQDTDFENGMIGGSADGAAWRADTGALWIFGIGGSPYGSPPTYAALDVIGVKFDADNGVIEFYYNGTTTSAGYTALPAETYYAGVGANGDPAGTFNFGATPFVHSVPSGANAGLYTISAANTEPTVLISATIAVDSGTLTLSGQTPSIAVTGGVSALPDAGALTLTGLAPSIAVTNTVAVATDTGALTLAGQTPAITVSGNHVISPAAGTLTLTGNAPYTSNSASYIYFRAGTTAQHDEVDNLELVLQKPTGTIANDVMVAFIGVLSSTAVITEPSGWTIVVVNSEAGTDDKLYAWVKVATASEPSDYTWTVDTASLMLGSIVTYVNVNTADPVDEVSYKSTVSSTSHPTDTTFTNYNDDMMVYAHKMWTSDYGFSPDAATTERTQIVDGPPNDGGGSLMVADEIFKGVGNSAIRTATSPSAQASKEVTVALRQKTTSDLTVDAGTLTLTGLAPSVAIVTGVATPAAGTLTLTGLAPSIAVTAAVALPVAAGTLALTGATPVVSVSDNKVIAVGAKALVLSTYSPSITASVVTDIEAVALELTGLEPSVGISRTIAVAAGALTTASSAPNNKVDTNVSPAQQSLALSGLTPTVGVTYHIAVASGALTLTTNSVTLGASESVVIEIDAGALAFNSDAPVLASGINIAVASGALNLSGQIVAVRYDYTIEVAAGALTLTGRTPTKVASGESIIEVPAGALVLTAGTDEYATTGTSWWNAKPSSVTWVSPKRATTTNKDLQSLNNIWYSTKN